MQQPAIQAALDNLVEVIRTALTAEFLEYFRGGDSEPVSGKRAAKAGKKTGAKKTGAKRTGAKKTGAKKTGAKKTGAKKTGAKKTVRPAEA